MNQHAVLTYQCQVGQFAQALAFVQDPLPLVADGVGAVTGLAAQLHIFALQEFAIHPAPRLGRLDWKKTQEVMKSFVLEHVGCMQMVLLFTMMEYNTVSSVKLVYRLLYQQLLLLSFKHEVK